MTCKIRKDTDIERICNTVIEIISKITKESIDVDIGAGIELKKLYIYFEGFCQIKDYLKTELEKEKDRIFESKRQQRRKEKEFCMRMNQRVCISDGTDENNVEKLDLFDISKQEDRIRFIKKLKDEEGIRKEECEKLKSEALHADDVVDIEINPKDLKIDVFGECPGVRIFHIPTCTTDCCEEYTQEYKNKDCAMKQLKEKLLKSGHENEKK